MMDTGYREEVATMKRITVSVTTVTSPRHALLIECSACGPLAVDTVMLNANTASLTHLLTVHGMSGVSV